MNAASGQSDLDELEKLSFSDTDPHNTKPQMYGIDYNNVGNYLGELDYHQLSRDKWVEGESWHAVFNPNIPRGGDIELVWQAEHEHYVDCVAYSKSGKYMAIGTAEVAIIYESQNGEEISRLDHEFKNSHEYVLDVCFDMEEKLLVTCAEDSLVRLYDISKHVLLRTYVGYEKTVYAVTISPDNTMVIACGLDDAVRVWRMADGELLLTLDVKQTAYSVAISPDGQYLAAGLLKGTIAVFSMNGPLTRKLEGADKHTDTVYYVRFTLDGHSLITASFDKIVKLWNHLTGEVLRTFSGHQRDILAASPFQNDSIILSGDEDGKIMAWNVQTGQALFLLQGHVNVVIGLDIHPTMGLFATASCDYTVKVWRYKKRA